MGSFQQNHGPTRGRFLQCIDAVSGSAATELTAGAPEGLDRDAFLRLLLAQLANQDPLEPIKDQAFVAQLAQFSSLERLEQIADSVQTLVSLTESQSETTASTELESTGG